MNAHHNEQMELSFSIVPNTRPVRSRGGRTRNANWWFERMRQVVDQAFDWRPALPPRPEQRWLAYRG